MGILTTDCRARFKDSLNLWIKLNHHFLFLCNIKVSGIQLCINPFSKRRSNNGMNNVGYILPGQFFCLFFTTWQCLCNFRIEFSIIKHVLYAQAFKLGNGYVKDIFSGYPASLYSSNILQMPNSNIFYWWQINVCFCCEKPIYLSFASILCRKGSNCYFSYLWYNGDDLIFLRHIVFRWAIKL